MLSKGHEIRSRRKTHEHAHHFAIELDAVFEIRDEEVAYRSLRAMTVSIQHHGAFVLAATQRIEAFARVSRRTHFAPINYFFAGFSNLKKSFSRLARLARGLQFSSASATQSALTATSLLLTESLP